MSGNKTFLTTPIQLRPRWGLAPLVDSEVTMPGYQADRPGEHQTVNGATPFGLSAIDRACIRQLVGHALAVIEREFILQTLQHQRGNRTRTADILRISIRSLRDRIRCYRARGESVPEPESVHSGRPIASPLPGITH